MPAGVFAGSSASRREGGRTGRGGAEGAKTKACAIITGVLGITFTLYTFSDCSPTLWVKF